MPAWTTDSALTAASPAPAGVVSGVGVVACVLGVPEAPASKLSVWNRWTMGWTAGGCVACCVCEACCVWVACCVAGVGRNAGRWVMAERV
ncbi:hypothetical protein D7V93_33145, partial [Corallococcus llansteffanensis]